MEARAQETTALTIRDETLKPLENRIKAMQADGEIHFPPNYSPQNALKSAWLILQDLKDKDGKPALDVCSKSSIYNALFDMVITGLNPKKKQGYLIVYGKSLAFQMSYFGSEALAKRVNPNIADIPAEVIYEGDEFEYEITHGRKLITKHKQKIDNVNRKNIIAAYAEVIGKNGEVISSEIMTMDEIKQSWKKSKVNPVDKNGDIKPGSTHDEFAADMCKRTVINKICKPIINSSDDEYLKIAATRSQVVQAEEESEEEIDREANQGDVIDIKEEDYSASSPGHDDQPEDGPEENPGDDNEEQPEDRVALFRGKIMDAANILGVRKYSDTLKDLGYKNINDVPAEDFENVKARFSSEVDKMNAGDETQGPDF